MSKRKLPSILRRDVAPLGITTDVRPLIPHSSVGKVVKHRRRPVIILTVHENIRQVTDGRYLFWIPRRPANRKEMKDERIRRRYANRTRTVFFAPHFTGEPRPHGIFHLCFFEQGANAGFRVYIAGADGSGLRQVPPMGGRPENAVWSSDQKSVYVNINKAGTLEIWKWNVDNSNPEKFVDNCGIISDADPSGKYLIGTAGEGTGIFEVSISDRKCISLLPGVVVTAIVNFARDGKSFLYAVISRAEGSIYRQPSRHGTVVGRPEVTLKVPFAFPLIHAGNAYDFSRDLSTIVYARPGGNADLYLLSQK